MAEGGDLSSTVRGSDSFFEYTCTPCADDYKVQEALKYCLECKAYLCAICLKYHQKFFANKNHTLHDRDFHHEERSDVDTGKEDDKLFKCLNHPDRDIEMYCCVHEMVYCSLCIAKEHRQCNEILELDEAAEKFPTNTEDLLQQIDDLQPDIKATKQKKIDNLIFLEQDKNDILKTIDDTESLIIGKVKELASDAKVKTCVRFDDLKKEFQHEISSLLQGITKIDELKTAVETQNTPDAKRNFVRYILQKRVIIQTKIMHDDTSKDERKMKCLINKVLIQRISTECFIHIVGSKSSLVSDTKPLYKKSQTEVNIKTTTDKDICTIYGICQLYDGTLILADYANKKLKRMNGEFRITEEFILYFNPVELCLIGKREVAVKLANDTIMFVSIDDKLMKKYSLPIEGGKYIGLACLYNELWCFTGKNIKVYDKRGTVLKTFSKETFIGTKFETTSCSLLPVTANDEFVFVSNNDKKVACIDREGIVWSVMECERLESVRSVCIGPNGIVFITRYDSGNIMMFSENGKCLGELVTGLDRPDSLCYDSQNHQLIVGHCRKNTLTIISTGE